MNPFRPLDDRGRFHYSDYQSRARGLGGAVQIELYPDVDGLWRPWWDLSSHALADLLGLRVERPTRWWHT